MTWLFERGVFRPGTDALEEAARAAGCQVAYWEESWRPIWPASAPGCLGPVVFRGSLEVASWISKHGSGMKPGAYCAEERFRCPSWYPAATSYLLHGEQWHLTTARQLVEEPDRVLGFLGQAGEFFVRPDSPLKPFSGRVVRREEISWEALDYGFYYEEPNLPIVVAPVRKIGREYRFVVVCKPQDRPRHTPGWQWPWKVVGGQYDPATHALLPRAAAGAGKSIFENFDEARWFAMGVAEKLEPPEGVYVMDVCESEGEGGGGGEGELRLLELNPFSGAELAGCEAAEVVAEVGEAAERAWAAR